MKVKIDWDEWYPVYEIGERGHEVNVDEETAARWKRVHDEFDAVQDEMRQAVKSCLANARNAIMTEAKTASGCTGPSSCSIPEDLRILRYHLKSAIADLDKYEGYNESGRRYIVESVNRVISGAFKRLNHFEANMAIRCRG